MDDINSVKELFHQVVADIMSNLDYDGMDYEVGASIRESGIVIRLPSPVDDGYVTVKIDFSENPVD